MDAATSYTMDHSISMDAGTGEAPPAQSQAGYASAGDLGTLEEENTRLRQTVRPALRCCALRHSAAAALADGGAVVSTCRRGGLSGLPLPAQVWVLRDKAQAAAVANADIQCRIREAGIEGESLDAQAMRHPFLSAVRTHPAT